MFFFFFLFVFGEKRGNKGKQRGKKGTSGGKRGYLGETCVLLKRASSVHLILFVNLFSFFFSVVFGTNSGSRVKRALERGD